MPYLCDFIKLAYMFIFRNITLLLLVLACSQSFFARNTINHFLGLTPKDSLKKASYFNYTIGLDGTISSGNVNRQLLNIRFMLNYENPNTIWGVFSSPKFQYGKNASILQEREIFLDINNSFFYSQSDIYGLIFGSFEESNLRKIQARTNLGIGIGWKILGGKKHPNALLKLNISNAILRETTDFVESTDLHLYRNSTRIRISWQLIPEKCTFQHTTFIQPSLSDNNIRWNSLSQLTYKIGKHLAINGTFDNTFENTNQAGVQSAQSNATIGFTYTVKH